MKNNQKSENKKNRGIHLIVISMFFLASLLFIELAFIYSVRKGAGLENGKFVSGIKDNTGSSSIFLSNDKKDIVINEKDVLLSIDDDTIFDWFKNETDLCQSYNIRTEEEKLFCNNKSYFKNLVNFKSIVISPDEMEIGFTIESEILVPDTLVGIFSRSTNEASLLSDYYLGNEFIGFSPSGTNFIYVSDCWEALCGLHIMDSKTFAEKANINHLEFADLMAEDIQFIQWISDNEVQYRINEVGGEMRVENISF